MKWGKRKAKPAKPIKSSNPVEITLSTDGRFYLHDTPGVVLQANRPFGRRDIDKINKHRDKGLSTMEAMAKTGLLGSMSFVNGQTTVPQKRALKRDKKTIDDVERSYKRGEIDDVD